MKEHPILFSAPMVRAILEGRKTQTRRVVLPQPIGAPGPNFHHSPSDPVLCDDGVWRFKCGMVYYEHNDVRCPFGAVGDRLWVRETWALVNDDGYVVCPSSLCFRAGGSERLVWPKELLAQKKLVVPHHHWRPSIHMPRWASRLTLEVTDVRVERVQQVTDTEAMREGWQCDGARLDYLPREWYRDLWNSLNARRGYDWDINPWVWVIDFKRVEADVKAAA